MIPIMIDLKNPILNIIVNILLFPWLLTQWVPGLICLAIFHKCEIYTHEKAHLKVIKVDKVNFNGNACFSLGPIIFVTSDCDLNTINHEVGHSIQSLIFGPLYHFIVSIPSIIRYFIRHKNNLSYEWYLSGWPESSAEKLGHVDRTSYLL